MKKLLVCVAAMVTFASCVEEKGLEPQPVGVTIVTKSADVKSVLDTDGSTVLWENNDKVRVAFTGSEFAFVDFTTEVEGGRSPEALFEGTLPPEIRTENGFDPKVFAVYPTTAVNNAGDIAFNLPAEQVAQADGSFASGLNLTSASVSLEELETAGTTEAMFRNALAILQFTLPEDVVSVTVTGTAPFAGSAPLKVNFSNDDNDGRLVIDTDAEWKDDAKKMSVTLTPSGEEFEAGKKYSVLIWPGEHSSLGIRMVDADGCEYVKEVNGDFAFAASNYYTLNVNTKFVKDFVLGMEGRAWTGEEDVKLVLSSSENVVYAADHDVLVADGKATITSTLGGEIVHQAESLTGYILYPAAAYGEDALSYAIQPEQTPESNHELYSASVNVSALVNAGEDCKTSFASALAKFSFVVPEGISSVMITAAEALAGTAEFTVANGVIAIDREGMTQKSVTLVPQAPSILSAGTYSLTVWPGDYTGIVVTLYDNDSHSTEVEIGKKKVTAGETVTLDLGVVTFTQDYVITPSPAVDAAKIKVVFGDYSAVLEKAGDKFKGTLDQSSLHGSYDKGYAVYPYNASEIVIPAAQTVGGQVPVLATALLKFADLKSGAATAEFADALATLGFTLPANIKEVKVDAGETISGTATLAVSETAEVTASAWSGEGNIITLADGGNAFAEGSIYMFPGTYDLTVTLTDMDGCTVEKVFNSTVVTVSEPATLDCSDLSFGKTYTISSDVAGPIDVVLGDNKVQLTKTGGAFEYTHHDDFAEGYAFYPAGAYESGVSVSADMASCPDFWRSEFTFDGDKKAAAVFVNAFATLKISVPANTTSVTLTSADNQTPLAGKMIVDNNAFAVAADGRSYTVTSTNITDNICTIHVLPGQHTSIMAAIEISGDTFSKRLNNISLNAGSEANIDCASNLVAPLTLNPAPSYEHTFVDGDLSGTSLRLDLGVDENRLSEIESINVTVTRGGETYRSLAKTAGFSKNEYINDGSIYLPHGTYDVSCEYKVVGRTNVVSAHTSINVSLPSLNVTVSSGTYNAGSGILIESARINVSNEVLAECPLSYRWMGILPWAQVTSANKTWTKTWGEEEANSVTSPIFFSNKSIACNAGEYCIQVYAQFDGNYIYNSSSKLDDVNKKIVAVSKEYKIDGNAIDGASELEDGALYVIHQKSSTSNWWIVGNDGTLGVASNSTSGTFYPNQVFQYKRDLSKIPDFETYSSESAGTWKSLLTDKYLSSSFKFDSELGSAQYLFIANKWKNTGNGKIDPGGDVDVYKADTSQKSLWYYNGFVFDVNSNESYHGGNTNNRKWVIYKVVAK